MDSIKHCVAKLISKLTLDEKLAQLGSCWMYNLQTDGELDWKKISDKLKHDVRQIARVPRVFTLDPVNADMELCISVPMLFQWSPS